MANNQLLYNAALSGFLSGVLAGAYQTDSVQGDYTAIVNQAVVFATAIDASILTDTIAAPQPAGTPGISNPDGTAVTAAGSTGLVSAQSVKPQLMQALCFGAAFQRYITALPSSNFATVVAAIRAIYLKTLLSGSYT